MEKHEVEQIVKEINKYIEKELWFDFTVISLIKNEIIIQGGLSLTYPEIEIRFKDIFFTSLLMDWNTDTRNGSLYVLDGEEATQMNLKLKVERSHFIFKFVAEEYSEEVELLIVAKQISYRLLTTKKDI
ncbi:hypothetical protein QE450_003619 [Paenibacillus sp. SORGH_AS306]|uniref:hypothetical protein n=1 Tax=unclassified Paenibacillus TaxID=185978 RepID=UPI00277F4787|nr:MULTISPECIES: hypothetical protein [unclassified Paenibacillus]MDQ1236121.1 hypothetical protein [Paenibacillus sp. SORGH_AS_0306]MDR6108476.1 hypothetical protein [Paenibacillus sp. SORGH_AS_0338]